MKQLVFIFFVVISLFSLSVKAESRAGIRASDFSISSEYVPEILELVGIVKSDGTHHKDCNVALQLVESKTGKTFRISEPRELGQLHCVKEKDFLVSMKAERTPKFLFWGGNLIVQDFEILEEVDSLPHIPSEQYTKSSFDRGPYR